MGLQVTRQGLCSLLSLSLQALSKEQRKTFPKSKDTETIYMYILKTTFVNFHFNLRLRIAMGAWVGEEGGSRKQKEMQVRLLLGKRNLWRWRGCSLNSSSGNY